MNKLIFGILILITIIFGLVFLFFSFNTTNDPISEEIISKIERSIVFVKYQFDYVDEEGNFYSSEKTGSGIISYSNEGFTEIFTNRHVVDCSYTYDCYQRAYEKISVITFDGEKHNVTKVSFAPHNFDIALLEIETNKNYPIASYYENELNENENVVAIGYPGFADKVVEKSIEFGIITKFRNLMTIDGFPFKSIDSDAYIDFGSSGGGLFDANGNLIGITTWGDDITTYALDVKYVDEIELYDYCEEGYYEEGECFEYCSGVYDENGKCIEYCLDFYCDMEPIYGGDPNCEDESLILGTDGNCYDPCGLPGEYCADLNSVCLRNECVVCPEGTMLFEDGICG